MKNKSWTRTFLKIVLSIAVIFAVFVGTLLLLPKQKLLPVHSLLHTIGKVFSGTPTVGGNFVFDAHMDHVYAEMGGMLLITSRAGVQLFDENGSEALSSGHTYAFPAVSGGTKAAAIWDIGGTQYAVVHANGEIDQFDAPGALISVSMNENDWFAVASEETRYKGSVTVYDSDASPVFQWNSGVGYVVDADLSPSNQLLAVVTLTQQGSRIVSFSLNSEEEKGSFQSQDTVYFDLEQVSDSRLCAISDHALSFFNESAERTAEYRFSDEYLKDYSLDGDGIAVLLLGKYRAGGKNRLVTVDVGGSEAGSLEIDGEVLSISAKGRLIAGVYPDQIVLYRSDLSEYGVLKQTTGIKKALVNADGTAYIISGNSAAIFSP
jgi:hypothetical protein